ncbi:hypothetical protein LXA43DRAFT_1092535 [Ganoderma leucocontextum]|nr:hypothetical protein LXA43DRAFT_1092535 [Ganoderma leucocontextum]
MRHHFLDASGTSVPIHLTRPASNATIFELNTSDHIVNVTPLATPLGMNGARRGLVRAGEHIDIHLPPGRGGADDDDDDGEDNDIAGANTNIAGVAARQLQLPPLPENATVEQLMNAYRDAQLTIQAYSEESERRAAQAQSLMAAPKANEKKGRGQSRDPPPPPGLASLEKEIAQVAREYSVLISLWPPAAYWAFVTLERPDVDPYDPEQRYPGSGAGAVRVRGTRGRDMVAEALQKAVIAELHDFMGKLSVHLTNKWVQHKFAKSVNLRKSHMMDDLRTKRGQIFSGLPDVDSAVLDSNDLARIRNDPAIKRWISLRDESGRPKKWPDLFYHPDKAGDIKYLFRAPWLHRAMKLMTQGRTCLTEGHRPRTNVSAVKWGLGDTSYGFIAAGAVGMLHLLSGDSSFETTPGPSGLNYPRIHAQVVEHLIKTCERRQTILLFDWLQGTVFGSMNPETTNTSSQAEEEDVEVEDYNRLDESDSDEAPSEDDVPETPPSLTSGTRPSTGTPFESASSSNPPRMSRSDLPHALPAAALTSASSQLSYASIRGVPSSSTPSHGAPAAPLPPLSGTYQPQPVGHQFTPPVVTLLGALSDVFFTGTANSGYVVAAPRSVSSYTDGTRAVRPAVLRSGAPAVEPAGRIPIQPAIGVGVAPVPIIGVPVAPARGVAVAPGAGHMRAVLPPAPASVAPTVNHVNVNHTPPPSDLHALPSTSSHPPHPHTSSLAPLVVDTTSVDEELSEAASHLDVGATKRRGARTKASKSAPGVPTRYSTRARHGQS